MALMKMEHYVKVNQFVNLDDNNLGIWYVGGKYAFDSNVKLVGEYAQSDADAYEKAGIVEVQYKGSDVADPGSWGAYAGYRHLGNNVAVAFRLMMMLPADKKVM